MSQTPQQNDDYGYASINLSQVSNNRRINFTLKQKEQTQKIGLLENKMQKIRISNLEHRRNKSLQMREYKREVMERFEPIFNHDVQMIRSVPRDLCRVDV